MKLRTSILAVVLSALLPAARLSAEPATSPLEGLWEVLSITNLTTGKVQPKNPEYHMYTATHEMIILTGKDRERIKKSLSDMSAEEVMSQQPMGAGFYEDRIEGGELIRTAVLTLSEYYVGRTVHTDFELNGDSLTVRDSHSADGQRREWKMRRVE